jgi:hypothetical protein
MDVVAWVDYIQLGQSPAERIPLVYEAESRLMQWTSHCDSTTEILRCMSVLSWLQAYRLRLCAEANTARYVSLMK